MKRYIYRKSGTGTYWAVIDRRTDSIVILCRSAEDAKAARDWLNSPEGF